MRHLFIFLLCGMIGLSSVPSFGASQTTIETLERKYLDAYTLVRQAFLDKNRGFYDGAIRKFETAKVYIDDIQSIRPSWQTNSVEYLRRDCEKQIQVLSLITSKREIQRGVRTNQLLEAVKNIQTVRRERQTKPQIPSQSVRNQRISRSSTPLPTLSQLIKKYDTQKFAASNRKAPKPTTLKRVVPSKQEPVTVSQNRNVISRDREMLAEKLKAIEAGYLQKKKESEQWKLQYSVLQEKARKEIQSLTSEFSKEKAGFEAEVRQLEQELDQVKVKVNTAKENRDSTQLKEQVAQYQKTISLSGIKIAELKRALQEAQTIKSRAEEEAKIREGRVVLRIRDEFESKANRMEQEFKNSKKILDETSIKIAQKDEKIGKLEQKLVQSIRQKAEAEEKLTQLQVGQASQAKLQEGQASQAQIELEELKVELVAAQEEIIKGKAGATNFEKQIDQFKSESQLAESKIKILDEEKAFFLDQEKVILAEKAEIKENQKKLQERFSRLEQELNQSRSDLAIQQGSVRKVLIQAENKSGQIKSENERTIMNLLGSFKKEKKKWSSEVVRLKKEIEAQTAPKDLLAKLEFYKNENQEILAQNKTLIELKIILQEELKTANQVDTFAGLEQEKEYLQAQLKEIESFSKLQTEKIDIHQKRIKELSRLLEGSETEKKDLYVEVNRLSTSVAQLRLDIKRTDDINALLRESVKSIQLATPISPVTPETTDSILSEAKGYKILNQVKKLFVSKEYLKALAVLEAQLKTYPNNDRFLFYQGLALSRLNRNDEAIKSYEAAIKANDKSANAFNNLGNLYSQGKKYGKAIENLKKATELDPQLSEAYNNMGIVYSHLEQYDEAIRAFIKATDLNPSLVAAFYNLGQIYYHDDMWDAAQTSFQKVISLTPDHEEAKEYLIQITEVKNSSDKNKVVLEQVE